MAATPARETAFFNIRDLLIVSSPSGPRRSNQPTVKNVPVREKDYAAPEILRSSEKSKIHYFFRMKSMGMPLPTKE